MVGATPFCEDMGRKADSATLEDLGRCDKAILDKETCKIIKGHGKPEEIAARIQLIHAETAATNSTYDKDKLKERLARISGGVAIIKVGGATEVEVRERKYRVEDSMHATRAALQEGYVAGGGVALLRASKAINALLPTLTGAEQEGARLLQSALRQPLAQIVANAGLEGAVVIEKVLANKSETYGFDAQALEYGDMISAGILDPFRVVRAALTNAASIAGLMLTTEAIILNKPKPKPKAGPQHQPNPGMMDMGGDDDDHDHDH
jgi:chaperonin GroEL